MKTIVLDLTGCATLWELHQRIRIAFDFSEWYGKNWDAFWDLLWSECDAEKVVIQGESTMPQDLKKDLYQLHRCLEDNVKEHEDSLQYGWKPFSYEILS